MADTSNLTIHQAWQTPFIKGVYSELATPDMAMSSFYRMMDNRVLAPARIFGWDQFNMTRTVATMSAPMTAPSTITRQKIATKTGALLRIAEKLFIGDEEIMNLRPPGAPIGTLDTKGERWFTQQVEFMTQRHRNLLEILTSLAIQGGFGLAKSGEMYYLTDLNASGNEFDIDMFDSSTVRDKHTGDLDGIIDVSWDDPTAPIIDQLQVLRQRQIAEYGAASSVAWTDARTIGYMMKNIDLAQIAGSANRVWDSWDANGKATDVKPGDRNLGGQRIVFHAIPQWTWIVNDGVVSLGTSSNPQGVDSFDYADLRRVVPAGHVLFTPPPGGDWIVCYEGQEPVRTNWTADSEVMTGFAAWNFPLPQFPPGREAHILDNLLPVIRFPRAIWNATVRTADPAKESVLGA